MRDIEDKENKTSETMTQSPIVLCYCHTVMHKSFPVKRSRSFPAKHAGDNPPPCQSMALHAMLHAITVPVCRQQPNRHENLTESTKGRCQTKPLVMSERAPKQARSGSTTAGSALTPSLIDAPSQLSGRTLHVCFSFNN